MSLFLGCIFCPTDLYVFFGASPYGLITVALQYTLKSRSMIPLSLFFFLKIVLLLMIICGSIQILEFFVLVL